MDTELGKARWSQQGREHGQEAAADAGARTLSRIERALERMDSGDYGFCVTCGEALSLALLESDPAAAVCKDCKS